MWFDVNAARADIEATPPATIERPAMDVPRASAVSRMSRKSQPPEAGNRPHVAEVADVATPDASPSASGEPRTWTGRVVSLAEWRRMSEWERHGPNGRLWCGICRAWHHPGKCQGGE